MENPRTVYSRGNAKPPGSMTAFMSEENNYNEA
jgi:hypothetical protein